MKNKSTFWGLALFCIVVVAVIGFFFYRSTIKDNDTADVRPIGYANDIKWCYDLLSRSELETIIGEKLKHYYEYSQLGYVNTCNYVFTDGGPTESAEINANSYNLFIELSTCTEKQPECFDYNDVLDGKDGPQDTDVSLSVGLESRTNPQSPEARFIFSRNAYLVVNIRDPKETVLTEQTYPTRERIFRQIAKLLASRLPENVK